MPEAVAWSPAFADKTASTLLTLSKILGVFQFCPSGLTAVAPDKFVPEEVWNRAVIEPFEGGGGTYAQHSTTFRRLPTLPWN